MPKTTRKNEARWVEVKAHWRIDVQANAQRKVFYSSTKGRKGKIECEGKADDWLEGGNVGNPRLEGLWSNFLAETKKTTSNANYVKHEQIGRLYLLPTLKNRRVKSITLQNWQDTITAAYEKGLSKKTCQNIRGAITTLYNYAKKNRVGMERPEHLSVPRDAKVGERTILQPDQLRTLFSVDWIEHYKKTVKCPHIHAWRFIALTGLRRGELCGLRWEDYNGDILKISRSVNSLNEMTTGKNDNARRYIALSPLMKKELEDQKNLMKKAGIISPWIFPEEGGDMLTPARLYKTWYTYRKQHNLPSSIHELSISLRESHDSGE